MLPARLDAVPTQGFVALGLHFAEQGIAHQTVMLKLNVDVSIAVLLRCICTKKTQNMLQQTSRVAP